LKDLNSFNKVDTQLGDPTPELVVPALAYISNLVFPVYGGSIINRIELWFNGQVSLNGSITNYGVVKVEDTVGSYGEVCILGYSFCDQQCLI
jgi:hypothetical protein